ncbi:MAG: hypothetical protein E5W43_00900 [Mesorhizobium sp.]|nr:MAG: hypothetical protein E5W43_00900 [Mesorhizobium sp.]
MSLTVKKPFNTALQRFKAGDEIPDDTELFPHTAESLASGGFVGNPPKSSKAKAEDKPTED